MSHQPTHAKASDYFNVDCIINRLDDVASSLGYHLKSDIVSFLVNATTEEKRDAFRDFIFWANAEASDGAVDDLMAVLLGASLLRSQQYIDALERKQHERLTSYVLKGWEYV